MLVSHAVLHSELIHVELIMHSQYHILCTLLIKLIIYVPNSDDSDSLQCTCIRNVSRREYTGLESLKQGKLR